MTRTKKIWVRAIAGVTLALAAGLVFVNASQNKVEVKEVKDIAPETKVQSYEYRWYELVSTTKTDAKDQTLASTTLSPMSSPPPSTDPMNCAQNSLDPNFCAVVLRFPAGTTNFTLTDANLQDAIDNHPVTISIATGNTAVDINGDGYSKKL